MTRKDCVLLAQTIRLRTAAISGMGFNEAQQIAARQMMYQLARDMAINLEVENPRFKRDVFMAAAGFPMTNREAA